MSDMQARGASISRTSLLLLGLISGLIGGLYYAWLVDPVVFVNAGPARFSNEHKAEYIYLVSQNFAATGNLPQARQRLAALDDPELDGTIVELLESSLREQRAPAMVQALAELAQALDIEAPTVALFVPDGEERPFNQPTPSFSLEQATATPLPSPTILPTSSPTATISPTRTQRPTPTSRPVYRLLTQTRSCERDTPLIEVITLDALLEDLAGVEVLVRWEGGSDRFFTGFKANEQPGYGDFSMEPDTVYTIVLADGSPHVENLQIEPCDNGRFGGWQLTFQNLTVEPTPEP